MGKKGRDVFVDPMNGSFRFFSSYIFYYITQLRMFLTITKSDYWTISFLVLDMIVHLFMANHERLNCRHRFVFVRFTEAEFSKPVHQSNP